MGNVRLTVRIDFGAERALGPGKIRLLEAIGKTGSISRAGRALGMSYRRAWLLIDDMNRYFPRGGGGDATRRREGRRRCAHAVRRCADRELPGDRSAGGGSGDAAFAGAGKFIAPKARAPAKTVEDVDPGRHRALIAPPRR